MSIAGWRLFISVFLKNQIWKKSVNILNKCLYLRRNRGIPQEDAVEKSKIIFLALTLSLLMGSGAVCLAQLLDMDNTRINADTGVAAQYDESVAINRQNPDNAVIVWQDMRSGYPRVGVAYTIDSGAIWNEYLLDLPAYPSQSEPSAAADADGNFFICMIGQDTSAQGVGDIIILRSTDGGVSWSEPMIAVSGTPDYHDFMPTMTIDNTPFGSGGFIYVAWVRYANDVSASLIYGTQSSDAGYTFLEPVQVSDNPGVVRWPNVSIRSAFGNADVDVSWFRSHYPGILFDHSVTEGWSFGHDYWPTVTGAVDYEINGGIVVSTTPVMAADNQSGSGGFEKAYLVYMDSSNSNWDIFCSTITSFLNGGEYIDFSPPVRVNDDPIGNGADQFMPAVAVDETGTIHVVFFDRRLDTNNLLYDLYYTSSTDFGYTWTPNVRITNVSSDPSQPPIAGRIGNRVGIAAREGHVVITWTDCRNGNADIYTSRMLETEIIEEPAPLPWEINLDYLYPNPFNNSVAIRYSSKSARQIRVDIVDILGRHVANLFDGACRAGYNSLIWNGRNSDGHSSGSGIYFVRLTSGNQTLLKKAVLLK